MRKRAWILAAAAAAGALLLSACTSSEEGIGQDVSDAGASQGVVSQDGAADGGQSQGGSDQGTADVPADQGTAPADPQGGEAATEPQAAVTEQQTAATEAETAATTESESGTIPDSQDIWSGTYIGEQETITIGYVDAANISFSCAQAGISGTASVDGYQAVYHGDDYHVMVFEVNDDLLNVTVTSEEDYDASGSPLNGTYVRQ